MNTSQRDLTALERVLTRLDVGVGLALTRMAIGASLLSLQTRLLGRSPADAASLVGVLIVVLVGLRLVPAAARKVLGFSPAALALWAERRQTGKRVDSYQWRKLLWIGMGLGIDVVVREVGAVPPAALALFCVVSGLIGTIAWRARSRRLATAPMSAGLAA
jgi:hypothetical protein